MKSYRCANGSQILSTHSCSCTVSGFLLTLLSQLVTAPDVCYGPMNSTESIKRISPLINIHGNVPTIMEMITSGTPTCGFFSISWNRRPPSPSLSSTSSSSSSSDLGVGDASQMEGQSKIVHATRLFLQMCLSCLAVPVQHIHISFSNQQVCSPDADRVTAFIGGL